MAMRRVFARKIKNVLQGYLAELGIVSHHWPALVYRTSGGQTGRVARLSSGAHQDAGALPFAQQRVGLNNRHRTRLPGSVMSRWKCSGMTTFPAMVNTYLARTSSRTVRK